MPDIAARAAEWGLDSEYIDARGDRRAVPEATLQRLLAVLGAQDGVASVPRRSTLVWRKNRPNDLAISPASGRSDWQLISSGGEARALQAGSGTLELPDDVALGVYRLRPAHPPSPAGELSRDAEYTLVVAPPAAYQMDDVEAERVWVLAVQLYAVRSRRNWGHGDFGDLLQLVRLGAEIGAAGIGLNPLHALFDDYPEQASPYSPNSRLFLNPLYIDLAAVPEFPGAQAAGLDGEIASLRETEIVDYGRVAAAKAKALRLAYQRFRERADPAREADFAAFRSELGDELTRFAAFEVLRRRFQRVWWEWPPEWRDPGAEQIAGLRAEAPEEIGYFEFVQWLADRQLAQCQAEARRLALPVGLYVDLAVGVEPGGADAWSEQHSMVQQAEVGAPPDLLNTAGQAWGLAAFSPRALEDEAFAPFARLLQAAMRHAGAIRLDHVLGLNRLYLIPLGAKPQEGAYVRYPLQALLAMVALESARHRCLVIGEDLGTVPEELRGILADWGVWSYLVMLFERRDDGCFRGAEEYRRNALVTFSTHDLPTFPGWLAGHDLQVKWDLGIDPGESREARKRAKAQMRDALRRSGLAPEGDLEFIDVVRFLARTPSRMMVVSIEDVLGLSDQPNVPGTVHEHPNWRRRLPVNLEDLGAHEGLRRVAGALAREGRACAPRAAP
jgi:4-alpha-glucanotransferase